jgi:uridylate kinase
MKTTILSLGGSLIVPEEIDIEYIKQFRELILSYVKKGERFIICCGGGKVCRKYQNAAKEITDVSSLDGDWIGITATKMNAEFIRAIFSKQAYEKVINNPEDQIDTDKLIIVGAGYKPGHSSDMDAVLLAKNFEADTLINMSNIDLVYDKDPNKYDYAKPIKQSNWDDFLEIIGDDWVPGKNVPFDPVASKRSKENGLKVIILNGKNIDNLKNCFDEKDFVGTVIS